MSAGWVFVCGPSGAGKDSVIACARDLLAGDARVVFARRMVTRPAGPALEHDEVSRSTLQRLALDGKLAWHWEAHGHLYGVAGHYEADVAAGRLVVVNGSREHVSGLAGTSHRRVLVTAAAEVLAERLRTRARDSEAAVRSRLARSDTLGSWPADRLIHNNGDLAQAGGELAACLRELAA